MITHVIWDMGETLNTVPNTRYDHYPLDTYPEVVLRKDAKETLEKVKQLGFKQAILSNTATSDTEVIKRVLTNFGIIDYFDFIYASNSELQPGKMEKPDKTIFDFTLNELQIDKTEAVMVGNTFESDIIGANRAGIHAIWLQNPEVCLQDERLPLVAPPFVIPVWDLADVPEALLLLNKVSA
ncbi:HAD family hydrolase [Listeria monocytogenes]|uniref:HAD family hydrolase n=1 Tax=Listeria monocytogenes serotype 1/2a TaxID=1906951 RepID=A0A9P2DRD7_LISMN|nr:HAD family hydrolase [Listeria monocytogenes]EAF3075139.1 HAD family hydrolase [Listeria monocytogenes serotype 1/2a]EAF3114460.1 HAD family hydrolase [Listeria monocytogenes]EAF3116674.1 HAD family hydrolase [Listeria monocytogenes]EAF3120692.1 HAD family hydrolase [Listeria monocytogenes]EAF3123455.1 HAD family hydrolase [Listeria monocytogenes]